MSPAFYATFLYISVTFTLNSVKAEVKAPATLLIDKKVLRNLSLALATANQTTKAPKFLLNLTTLLPLSSTKIQNLRSNVTTEAPKLFTTLLPLSSNKIQYLRSNVTTEAPKSFLSKSSSTETPKTNRTVQPEASLNSSITTDFVIPKAISVIPGGGIQMVYHQDNLKPKVDDFEETFTYQVKRQTQDVFPGKTFAFKSPWGGIFKDQDQGQTVSQTQQGKAGGEDNLLTNKRIDGMNEKILQLEEKISSMVTYISVLEKKQNSTSENANSTVHQLSKQLVALNKTLDSQSVSTKEIQKTLSFQKDRIEGQIQTLTMHLRHLQNLTSEQSRQGTKKLEHILSTVQNATHEIRLNEVRTRYNQKALTTLDRLVQANNEKIADLSTSEAGPRFAEQNRKFYVNKSYRLSYAYNTFTATGCGGILVAEEGVISYKFRQPYLNNERCIWTLRANRRSRIVLQLLEDGFQNSSNSDFITVTEFIDDQPSSLVTSSRIEHGNRAIHTFRGPLIFVTFYSDSSIPGNGFTLKYKGSGNVSAADVPNAIRYQHSHLKEAIGHLTYPDENNLLYQPNEIATFTINPTSTAVKVHLRYTDLEKEESCEYDSVNFYGSVMASFALAKKYCEQNEVYTGEALQSSDGTFIIVFKSDGTTQFKGFQFSWETL